MGPLWAWAAGFGVTTLSFFIQIRPRIVNRYFGVDSWRHLDEADEFRRHHRLPAGQPERYLITKPSDYPPLLRVVLALIPKALLERWEWVIAPAFDALHNLLLFGLVWTWTGRVDLAVIAQLTYCLSPLVIMENSNLTTRSFASLLFTLGWFPLMAYRVTGQPPWLVLSILVLALLFLAHRLAIQALCFLCLVWSLFNKTWFFLGVFLAAMGVAFLLSGGFYRKILWGHLTMLNYWRINIGNRFAHQIRGLPSKHAKDPDAVFRIYQMIRRAPFVAVLGANPLAMFLIPWLIQPQQLHHSTFGISSGYLPHFLFWATALWGIGLVIRQCPSVRFLGEGERYLEYGAFPTAVLTAVLIGRQFEGPHAWGWFGAFAGVTLGAGLLPGLILQRQVVLNDVERSVTPELRQIFAYLNAQFGEIRLFAIPLYLASATVHLTNPHVKVLTTDSSYAHLTDLTDLLPVLKIPMSEVARRYRLTHLLVSERYVTLAELGARDQDVVMRAGIFCLVAVSR